MPFKSYAKINLFLDVKARYQNGFHRINSIFSQISLYDEIDFSFNNLNQIRVFDRKNQLPPDNLLTRAAGQLIKTVKNIPRGVDFKIDKNIPIGGGLGGGSSNAAAVLKILNRIWQLNLSKQQLEKNGAHIGADVPYFIRGGLQKVTGKGDQLKKLPLLQFDYKILLIIPPISVSTVEAYSLIDRHQLDRDQYENHKKFKAFLQAVRENNQARAIKNIYNKFEQVIFNQNPLLAEIKEKLLANGAVAAFMSGSGSTLVGLYQHENILKKTIEIFDKIGYKAITVELIN